MSRAPVAELIGDLAGRLGVPGFVAVCVDLLGGADRAAYAEELRGLTGHDAHPGAGVMDRDRWRDYWVRTWGARGLLHVWDDEATDAVVRGLGDEHWRPAEMCLKVTARHDVAGTADGAVALVGHPLPRVRAQALRALAVVGDTEHVAAVLAAQDDADAAVRLQAERARTALEARLDLGRSG